MSHLRYGKGNFFLELVMIVVALIFAFPIYVLVVTAIKEPAEITESPIGLPKQLYTANFTEAWQAAALGQAMINSTVITAMSIALLVGIGSLAAYGIVRGTRRINGGLFILFILGLMIPIQLGMVPLYDLMKNLNLLRTYTSLIVFYTGALMPITIFLYAGFIRALPRSYEEAALVDGASHWRAFSKIVFPLLRPITGTVIILNALSVWNDLLIPILYVGGTPLRTLPVAVFAFQGEYASDWGIIFAGLIIAIIPILVMYFLLQKYIIKGFASGLKG